MIRVLTMVVMIMVGMVYCYSAKGECWKFLVITVTIIVVTIVIMIITMINILVIRL